MGRRVDTRSGQPRALRKGGSKVGWNLWPSSLPLSCQSRVRSSTSADSAPAECPGLVQDNQSLISHSLSSTHRPASSLSPASSLNPSPSSTHNQGLFTRLQSDAGSPVYNFCHPAPWAGLPDLPLTPLPALTGTPSHFSRGAFAHLAPSARHALPATSQDRLLAGGTSPLTKPLRSAQHSFSASCFIAPITTPQDFVCTVNRSLLWITGSQPGGRGGKRGEGRILSPRRRLGMSGGILGCHEGGGGGYWYLVGGDQGCSSTSTKAQ